MQELSSPVRTDIILSFIEKVRDVLFLFPHQRNFLLSLGTLSQFY